MPDAWIIILGCVIVAALGVLVWFVPQLRKYFKYFIIVAPALLVLVLIILGRTKRRDGKEREQAEALRDSIGKIKDKLTEVNLETAIQVSAAKAKNEVKIEELKQVKKIPDRSERLKRLAAMMN